MQCQTALFIAASEDTRTCYTWKVNTSVGKIACIYAEFGFGKLCSPEINKNIIT